MARTEGLLLLKVYRLFWHKRGIYINPQNILPVDSAAFGFILPVKSISGEKKGDKQLYLIRWISCSGFSMGNIGGKRLLFPIPPDDTA